MAAGLPIVNTALRTAVPHVARHELEGLTVPPGDAVALASALNRLLDNRELAERYGRAAQDRAKHHYDRASVVSRTEQLYEETVKQRTTTGRGSSVIS